MMAWTHCRCTVSVRMGATIDGSRYGTNMSEMGSSLEVVLLSDSLPIQLIDTVLTFSSN